MKRMRWKAFFFLNPNSKTQNIETFGFKSRKTAPFVNEIAQFEKELTNLIQTIKFKKPLPNNFQHQLKLDLKTINSENRLLVKADKTTNYYKVNPTTYKQTLTNNITKNYKKTTNQTITDIQTTDKHLAAKLKLDDRMEQTAPKNAFITIKDHKPNFPDNPSYRLINPTKSELGKASKGILDKINRTLTHKLNTRLWRNTQQVTHWFNNIPDKHNQSFILFDICDFYPSITESLLSKALDYAQTHTNITNDERHIILHTKKALLFNENQPWTKKDSTNMFDVTMGSYDGAETCELVGTYLLSQLPDKLKQTTGLYRDDGLAYCTDTPQNIERLKKKLCAIFKKNNLKITIEANKKTVNYLDITLNLTHNTHKPYTKPNNNILYVNKNSNHPPSITKNLPENINKRLTNLSSTQKEFDETKLPYQTALKSSGYNYILTYKPTPNTPHKRVRRRNITWYNPPYSTNVQTNLGQKFLKIVDKCFPTTHKLHKLFNRNTVKLSYSCMPNMKTNIDNHNKKLLQPDNTNTDKLCNCRKPTECPLDNKCLEKSMIYQATVTRLDNNTTETYIGLCETDFKTRYRNHKTSLTHSSKRNTTELSKHIWDLKDKDINHTLTWKKLKTAQPYNNSSKRCNLCISEKYFILYKPEMATLNKRDEISNSCRHSRSYLLCHFRKWNPPT